jgi:hypothetical protein
MIYMLQMTAYSALLYAIYFAVLKDRASHSWNRACLLLSASLPLVIPYIKIPGLYNAMPATTKALSVLLPEVSVSNLSGDNTSGAAGYSAITMIIYCVVVLLLCCRMAFQYLMLLRFISQNAGTTAGNIKVALNTGAGPGSFGDRIFLPGNEIDPAIFEHELAHIKLKHSRDIIFMRLLQALYWPNIVLYIINRELKIVHEFQADAYAVRNKENYISTLLNDVFSTNRFAFAHTFFYHPLKRRIMMLQKTPVSGKKLRMTILKTGLMTTVLLSVIVYLQSCKQKAETPIQPVTQAKLTVFDTINAGSGKLEGHREVLRSAEVMPKPDYDLVQYLSQHLKYPQTAKDLKIEAKVFVEFVVDENGKINSATCERGDGSQGPDRLIAASKYTVDAFKELCDESIKVVSAMPDWQPGKQNGKNVAVHFVVPISWKLN